MWQLMQVRSTQVWRDNPAPVRVRIHPICLPKRPVRPMSDPLDSLNAALQSENLLDVSNAARALLQSKPDLRARWGEVASAALTAGDELAALNAAKLLCEAVPNHPDSWLWLAAVHSELGEYEQAVRVLEGQGRRFGNSATFPRRAGRALLELNQTATAELCFRKALQIDPMDTMAWEGLVASKTFKRGDPDLPVMEELRINWPESESSERRGILSFALAKAYEDIGEFEAAGRRVAEGAAFVRENTHFDMERHANGVAQILSIYDDRFTRANEEAGLLDARPVFILAPPCAGAMWLAQVLSAPENTGRLMRPNGLFWMGAAPLGDHTPSDLHQAFLSGGANVLSDVGRNYLTALGERFDPAISRVIDPSAVIEMAAGAAGLCLPAAKFIRITREPKDLAWSIYRRRFSKGRHWSYHPDDIARVMQLHNELCARWETLFADRMVTVAYEDLVADPKAALEPVCKAIGTDLDATSAEAWLRSEAFKSDPVGVHERAGSRIEPVIAALERAGLVQAP